MQSYENIKLPLVLLRGMVAFPYNEITFDAGRPETINAVNEAMKSDKRIFMTPQKNIDAEKVSDGVMNEIGVVGVIKQAMKLPGGITRIVVGCEYRAKIVSSEKNNDLIYAHIAFESDEFGDMKELDALARELVNKFRDYFAANSRMSPDVYARVLSMSQASQITDTIASVSPLQFNDKLDILNTVNLNERMKKLLVILRNEIDLISIQLKIEREVKKRIDKNQKDYYLHEQIKVIEKELGDENGRTEEMLKYRKKINKLNIDNVYKEKLYSDVERLGRATYGSPEGGVLRTYLDTVLSLPWNKTTKENLDIKRAEEILNRDHYGMEKVKESVLLNLAVRNFNARGSNILCLVGPPGVGKTSIVKSIAEALGRNYVRISLGGVHDEADIRGHRKTYIGSMCGRIIKGIEQADSKNALILLDEIDKVGADYRGDPSAALLEVLDSEQNFAFQDHYLEVPFDLSDVMFITTANTLDTISRPLLDRMDVIELSGYTREEKLQIAKNHLVPKAVKKTGLEDKNITFDDDAIYEIIDYYTRESGVRKLERSIIKIMSYAAKMFVLEKKRSVKITKKFIGTSLGKRIYSFDMKNKKDEVGTVRGLAWTAVGGDTLEVEVNVMSGSGKTELTGQLGDVMKESAMAAISCLRSEKGKYKVPPFYKNKDIHIHVPEGAVPKDGPSAGITMATAVYSALTGKKVRCDIAMTGEITLRGKVLPIGGLKEKSLAAFRAGIKTVIIPFDNKKDLEDIPENIKEQMEFIPVKTINDVLKVAIVEEK